MRRDVSGMHLIVPPPTPVCATLLRARHSVVFIGCSGLFRTDPADSTAYVRFSTYLSPGLSSGLSAGLSACLLSCARARERPTSA
ncbi:hypothetical protein EHYA_06530 [Embleya hyalina]|uniref:Uncharacterized protein n=1 Tax=Embleya hyalina TaxID=516124 RepID=A0A401YW67_9ACTN|nr:hypothetical protein EHYA_06530 [Embleya hyalina]